MKHILRSLSFENSTRLLPGVWFLRFPSLPPSPICAPNQSSQFGSFPCWPLQGMREEGDCLLSSFYQTYSKIKRHPLFVLKEQLKVTDLFNSHYLPNVLYQNTFSTISQGSYFSLQICQSCPSALATPSCWLLANSGKNFFLRQYVHFQELKSLMLASSIWISLDRIMKSGVNSEGKNGNPSKAHYGTWADVTSRVWPLILSIYRNLVKTKLSWPKCIYKFT